MRETLKTDWQKYVVGVVFAVGLAVLLSVSGELTDIERLGDIDLDALAVAAIKAAASALIAVLGTKVVS